MTGTHTTSQRNTNLPGPAPNSAGPHRHDWINRLDPTVDSMTSGVQVTRPGVTGSGQDPGFGRGPGTTRVDQPGLHASGAASSVPQRHGYGNDHGAGHSSKLANALDPRVDSSHQQMSGAANRGYAPVAPGVAPAPTANVREGTYGPHGSRAANALDPRVDSDLDSGVPGRTARGGHAPYPGAASTVGSGPAPTTAGPHRSDWANRLDPTVDSKPRHDYNGIRHA